MRYVAPIVAAVIATAVALLILAHTAHGCIPCNSPGAWLCACRGADSAGELPQRTSAAHELTPTAFQPSPPPLPAAKAHPATPSPADLNALCSARCVSEHHEAQERRVPWFPPSYEPDDELDAPAKPPPSSSSSR